MTRSSSKVLGAKRSRAPESADLTTANPQNINEIATQAATFLVKHSSDPLHALWEALTDSTIKGPKVAMAIVTDRRCGLEAKTKNKIKLRGSDYICSGATSLELAARAGRADVVAALAAAGVIATYSTLGVAVRSGSAETVSLVLKLVREPVEEKKASYLLSYAAHCGHSAVIELLAAHGWGVEREEPLLLIYSAASEGHLAAVQTLVRLGADMEEANQNYLGCALHAAAKNGHAAIVEFLCDEGANKEAKDEFGQTPLHLAVFADKLAAVKALVAKGANMEARTRVENETPLHVAAYRGKALVAEFLGKNGADIRAKNKNGNTPIAVAEVNNHFDVIDSLVKVSRGRYHNTGNWRRIDHIFY